MKILISDTPRHFVDLDAPARGTTEVTVDGRLLWRVWCRHCGHHHYHGLPGGNCGFRVLPPRPHNALPKVDGEALRCNSLGTWRQIHESGNMVGGI